MAEPIEKSLRALFTQDGLAVPGYKNTRTVSHLEVHYQGKRVDVVRAVDSRYELIFNDNSIVKGIATEATVIIKGDRASYGSMYQQGRLFNV